MALEAALTPTRFGECGLNCFRQAGVIAEIGATSDGTNASTYAWTNGWYIVGPYTSNMPVSSKWWYVHAFVTEDSGVLLEAYLTDGSNNNDKYVRWKGGGTWLTGWQFSGNADTLDGYHAGNSSSQVPISNGTRSVNLNADMLDGYHLGNGASQVPVNNGILNSGLNADKLDGYHASTAATADTIALRNSGGHLYMGYAYTGYVNMNHGASTRNDDDDFFSGQHDGFVRRNTISGFRQSLRLGYGTSMPPATYFHDDTIPDGANFFRTDLGLWCQYKSGIGWLTSNEYFAIHKEVITATLYDEWWQNNCSGLLSSVYHKVFRHRNSYQC